MVKHMAIMIGGAMLSFMMCAGDGAPIASNSALDPNFTFKPNFTFNMHLDNKSGSVASSQNESVQGTQASVDNKNSATAEVGDITLTQKVTDNGAALAALLAGQLKKEKASLQDFVSYCFENKFKATCYGLAIAYGYIFYRLKKMERALRNDHSWSLWKKQQSLQELYMTNDNELVGDLLLAIQGRYTNVHNLDDFNTPLTFFIKDVDREGHMLTSYAKLFGRLRRCKVGKFFPINKNLIEQAAQRKERLDYLKSRVWNWVSSYKVNQRG